MAALESTPSVVAGPRVSDLDRHFPRYTRFDPAVPVWCLTPELPRCQHRFFDTSPISPGGRFLAATRFATERRPPKPGDVAEIVIIDLQTGEARTVAETRGWEGQLGAQTQWGATDHDLLLNDVDPSVPDAWRAFGVHLDAQTGTRRQLEHTVYMASPDGRFAASPCLRRIGQTQAGYGALVPPDQIPRNLGAPDDDGVWVTDLDTGAARLVASLWDVAEAVGLPDAETYAFHVKWSPTGDRLMLVVRQRDGARFWPCLVTLRPDGSDIRLAVTRDQWARGGHHPEWCPDGEHILMNLRLADGDPDLSFVRIRFDGTGLERLAAPAIGGGHPRLHPDVPCLITDSYLYERFARDGTTPLRWVNLNTGEEREIVRIRTRPDCAAIEHPDLHPLHGGVLRVDPHPAFDRTNRFVAFNACPDGERQVFLADLAPLLGEATD